jgi:SPP1 family predicted phage head-tail adaptor
MEMINTGSIMRTSIDDLTERISIVYQTTTRNPRGDIVRGADVERGSVWAKVLPTSAPISNTGIEREARIGYRVIIRYRNDIRPDDEILWRGKRLRLTGTPYDAESRRIWTVLECQEAVQDGKATT